MSRYTLEEKLAIRKKRRRIDNIYNFSTFILSFVGVISLISIFVFVFWRGAHLISLDLIFGNYYATEYHVESNPDSFCYCEPSEALKPTIYYSSKWGIGVEETEDISGSNQIVIAYLHEDSPLRKTYDKYKEIDVEIDEGFKINRISFDSGTVVISMYGEEAIINQFEAEDSVTEFYLSSAGGGIRGSLISTLYLIFFSLLFALPLGIFTAIYLNEYASKNKMTEILRRFIEMLTGVPSIIFGLVGLVVFIPLTTSFGFTGRNVIAGALTLTIIILPTIIRATEESLKVIPNTLRNASLALGANKTQTTFKVVLPNALPGILTATLLGIGRVIGESAALIFVMGTIINDHVGLDGGSTTLAVQIWSIMGGEVANFELASAISLIILTVVLILNLTVKYISYRLNRAWH